MPTVGGENGLVTVVVPTYKRSRFLGRAIRSILGQSYPDWELIVVDDNPPDSEHRSETRAFMQPYLEDRRITYVEHEANKGGGAARNTGIHAARGEFVAFLDDDDEWHANKLEQQVKLMRSGTGDLGLVYGGFRRVRADTGAVTDVLPTPRGHELPALLKRNTIGTTSLVLCRREALLRIEGFDEALPSRQDIDMYVRMAKRYSLDYVPEVVVTWYRHGSPAVGKNVEGAIRAHEHFLEKHAADLRRYPKARAVRLFELAKLHYESGSYSKARELFMRSASFDSGNLSTYAHALLSNRAWHQLVLRSRGARQHLKRLMNAGNDGESGSASTGV